MKTKTVKKKTAKKQKPVVTETMRLGKRQCLGCGSTWKNKKVTRQRVDGKTKIKRQTLCYVCGKKQTGSRAATYLR